MEDKTIQMLNREMERLASNDPTLDKQELVNFMMENQIASPAKAYRQMTQTDASFEDALSMAINDDSNTLPRVTRDDLSVSIQDALAEAGSFENQPTEDERLNVTSDNIAELLMKTLKNEAPEPTAQQVKTTLKRL